VLLVAAGFEVSGGAGEIVGGGGSGCPGSIVARIPFSASLVGDGDPLKGNLSAFVKGSSSSFAKGGVPTFIGAAGRSGGMPALMIVVTMKRAPSSGAHNRASQRILAIAKSLLTSIRAQNKLRPLALQSPTAYGDNIELRMKALPAPVALRTALSLEGE
jgi:hypothetical protein